MSRRFVWLVLVVLGWLFGAAAQSVPRSVYVVNSLSENLSFINLENGTVVGDALPLGMNAIPNDIEIRGQRAYVVNSGLNEIRVIDLATLTLVQTIDLGSGTNPWSIEFVNDSVAAVSLWLTNSVALVNVKQGQLVQTIPVGVTPQGMAVLGNRLYVANAGFVAPGQYDPGTLSVVDLTTRQVVDTIAVGLNPQAVQPDGAGRLVVVCSGDYGAVGSELDVVDPAQGSVIQVQPLNVVGTSLGVNGLGKAFITTFGSGTLVYDLNAQSFDRDETNPLKGGPGVAFDGENNAYLADFLSDSVFVYNTGYQQTAAYLVGDGPVALAVFDPTVVGIEPHGRPLSGTFRLHPNYPNPFNPETVIEFELPAAQQVRLEVLDVLGRRVRLLLQGYLPAGTHQVRWDGRTESGREAAAGTYFYRLVGPN
ncbi:MAG: hypothetical protein D6715_03045, partial [Calditrichaeota bacterium]